MLLAALLLLCPLPQSGDIARTEMAKAEIERPAAVSEESTKDSTPAKALPSAPEAKVKTDAEVAGGASSVAIEPGVAPVRPAVQRGYETEHQKKEWYALIAVSSGAAAFDAWSTRRAVSGGYGMEANPLLKPFAHSNAIYAATQVSPLVMDLIGRKMMTSRHNWMRKLWWAPQMAGTNVSVSAAIHNVSIVH